MTCRSDTVFLYGPTWDAATRLSKHHLARYWAQTRRVLYVEGPPNPVSFYTRRQEAVRLFRRYLRGPVQVEDALWVHTYFYALPYRGSLFGLGGRWVNTVNQRIVRPQLSSSLRSLRFEKPVLFVCTAFALPLIDHIPHRLLVYHCSDDYTAVPSFPASFPQLEEELISRCDGVIATSEKLRQSKLHWNPNTFTVTNGADIQHFARTQAADTEIASELRDLERPVIGYVGSIFRWINQRWIKQAAKRLKGSFVFIGPIQTDVSCLEGLPNVHFLGPRPYDVLPNYLRGFDVATVPFTMDKVTLQSSPIKFYEYLAAGLPIVATRLPDLEPLGHLVHLVESAEEFISALQRAAVQDSPEAQVKRMEEAKKHTWEARYLQLDEIFDNLARAKT